MCSPIGDVTAQSVQAQLQPGERICASIMRQTPSNRASTVSRPVAPKRLCREWPARLPDRTDCRVATSEASRRADPPPSHLSPHSAGGRVSPATTPGTAIRNTHQGALQAIQSSIPGATSPLPYNAGMGGCKPGRSRDLPDGWVAGAPGAAHGELNVLHTPDASALEGGISLGDRACATRPDGQTAPLSR